MTQLKSPPAPPLLLHALACNTARPLAEWLRIRPTNALTVLDTHDGIGVVDIGADRDDPRQAGLVPPDELARVVESIHTNSNGTSRRATGTAAANVDLYQVNCTFYDALARNERDYLLARALQFFVPGVPQVYYVGLLAGGNDLALLSQSGVGRDVNRHYYDRSEILAALTRPIVRRLCALIRLRNAHPAFAGTFALSSSTDTSLSLRWQHGGEFAELTVDFAERSHRLVVSEAGAPRAFDLLAMDTEAAPHGARHVAQ